MSSTQALRERRNEVVGAVFSAWVVSGLFLDGWAHHAGKAESFWTPWHAVLYSGFAVAGLYALVTSWQARRSGEPLMSDKLVALGFGAFLLGGMSDAAWHTIFGVEEDLEALLSPTHLLLMLGGLLLTTSAVRAAWARPERAPSLRTLLPATVGMTLAISVVGFFLHFTSPFVPEPETYQGAPTDTDVALAVAGLLITTVLMMGATFALRARWELPRYTLLIMYTVFAFLMNGLHGLEQAIVVVPAALAGVFADALIRRGTGARVLGALVPLVLWSAWFATYGAVWGLAWTPELWSGAIVLGALTGYGLSFLAHPAAAPAGGAAGTVGRDQTVAGHHRGG